MCGNLEVHLLLMSAIAMSFVGCISALCIGCICQRTIDCQLEWCDLLRVIESLCCGRFVNCSGVTFMSLLIPATIQQKLIFYYCAIGSSHIPYSSCPICNTRGVDYHKGARMFKKSTQRFAHQTRWAMPVWNEHMLRLSIINISQLRTRQHCWDYRIKLVKLS